MNFWFDFSLGIIYCSPCCIDYGPRVQFSRKGPQDWSLFQVIGLSYFHQNKFNLGERSVSKSNLQENLHPQKSIFISWIILKTVHLHLNKSTSLFPWDSSADCFFPHKRSHFHLMILLELVFSLSKQTVQVNWGWISLLYMTLKVFSLSWWKGNAFYLFCGDLSPPANLAASKSARIWKVIWQQRKQIESKIKGLRSATEHRVCF